MQIVKAIPSDHIKLSEITMASKAYWDYSEEQLLAWKQDLTITTDYIEQNTVFNLFELDQTIGYYSIITITETQAELDNLFVLPSFIGKGYGKLLLNHAIQFLKSNNFKEVILYSDPNSTPFYLKNGFEIIGQKETSIEGRFLPIMKRILASI